MTKRTANDVERITKRIAEAVNLDIALSWSYGNKVQLYLVSEDNPSAYEKNISPLLSYSAYCFWANAFLDGVRYAMEYWERLY